MPGPTDRKMRRRRALLWLGIALVVAGLTLLFAWGGLKLYRVRTCLDSTLAHLRALQELAPQESANLASVDLPEASAHIQGLQRDLACLRVEAQVFLPLTPWFGWLPEVGPDIASAPVILDLAQALVDGGVLALEGLAPLVGQVQARDPSAANPEASGLDLTEAVAALDAARPSLAAAELKLQRAVELQAQLDEEMLSPRLGRLLDLTGRYLPLLQSGVKAGQLAPELLGAQGERTYLVLAQNDDERRPTGGWISGLGLVTINQGRIARVMFQDSWAVDNYEVPHEVPPESLFHALWGGIWLFRDANWSPDFPSSAQVAERILESDQGQSVDGVIAVNQQALLMLVAALEPLPLESGEEPVTAANLLTFIRDSWTEPQEGVTQAESWSEWAEHRKDFMADLVGAMLARVENRDEDIDFSKLVSAVWSAVQERHILVYLHNAEAAELLAEQRWDGAILETNGDYLQVVDANVGFNKVDPNVQRTITYGVDLTEPGQPQAEVLVHYQNKSQRVVDTCLQEIEWLPSYEEHMHGCYWDYVRFYVPEGSQLLTSEREPLPAGSLLGRHRFAPMGDAGPSIGQAEKGKTVFGLFFVLGPGDEREVRLAWKLPVGVAREDADVWRYQLLVQKQSGTPPIPLRVTVSLPHGAQRLASSPEPSVVHAEAVTFDLSLGVDQQIEVVFRATAEEKP
jgi:hypothetical protein